MQNVCPLCMLILHELLLLTFFISLMCCHNGAGKSVFHAQIEKSLFIESTYFLYRHFHSNVFFFSKKFPLDKSPFPYSRLVFLSLAAVTVLSEFCCITLTCYLCYCYSSDWTRQTDGMIHGLSYFFSFRVFHFSRLCKTKWCFYNCHLEVLLHCLAFYEMC